MRFWSYLINVSIVTRWTLFIIPVLAILWIPGILQFTRFPDGKVRTPLISTTSYRSYYPRRRFTASSSYTGVYGYRWYGLVGGLRWRRGKGLSKHANRTCIGVLSSHLQHDATWIVAQHCWRRHRCLPKIHRLVRSVISVGSLSPSYQHNSD